MKYNIAITEKLQRVVTIEARSESEALEEAVEQYRAEKIVLNSDDYTGTEFDVEENVPPADFEVDFIAGH